MRARPRRSSAKTLGVLVIGALAVFEILVWTIRIPQPSALWTFVAFVALAELFEIDRPRGVRSSLGPAPALAFVLTGYSVPQAAIVFAGGATVAMAARIVARRPAGVDVMLSRLLVVVVGGATYGALAGVDPLPPIGLDLSSMGIGAAFVAALAVDAAVKMPSLARAQHVALKPVARAAFPPLAVVHLSIVSVAGLLALAYPQNGLGAIPIFLGPLIVTHYAFSRLEGAETLYLQTIRALSRVPEIAGYVVTGHARRVADLSTAVARQLGLTPADISHVEYAALLHDIGRVALPDPSDDETQVGEAEVAAAGAAVAEESHHFPQVAEMIRYQHEPYRRRGEQRNVEVALGARIIKVVSAYDDLRHADGFARSAWEALEHLYLGMTYEYDPVVIQALVRVLERRGEPEAGLVADATRKRDATRLKDDFVSTVSHELRTPLTPIKGYVSLLLQYGDRMPDQHRREALESILSRTEHLTHLVEDLLLASKLSRDGEKSVCEDVAQRPTDLGEVVEKALRPFRVAHTDRTFDVQVEAGVVAIADPPRLQQVLTNLLSNALKFSEPGTPVRMVVDRIGDHARIHVGDHGRGIPADKHEAIFQKFTRLEDPLRMETGGPGLGLYIVRQLVGAMKGAVTVESTVGHGSTFTVSLLVAEPNAGLSKTQRAS